MTTVSDHKEAIHNHHHQMMARDESNFNSSSDTVGLISTQSNPNMDEQIDVSDVVRVTSSSSSSITKTSDTKASGVDRKEDLFLPSSDTKSDKFSGSKRSSKTKDKKSKDGKDKKKKDKKNKKKNDEEEFEFDFEPDDAKYPWYTRRGLRYRISQEKFHQAIIGLVLFDLLLVFVDLIIAISSACKPEAEEKKGGEGETGGAGNETTIGGGNETLIGGGNETVHNATRLLARYLFSTFEEIVNTTTLEGGNSSVTGEAGGEAAAVPTCSPSLKESTVLKYVMIVLFWMSVTLLLIFCTDVGVNIYARGLKFFKNVVAVVDGIIVYASLFMELYFHFSGLEESGAGAIVVLRIWKMVRAMHAIAHSVEMRNQSVIHAVRRANKNIREETERLLGVYSAQNKEFKAICVAAAKSLTAPDTTYIPDDPTTPPPPPVATAEERKQLSKELQWMFVKIERQIKRTAKIVEKNNQEEVAKLLEITNEVDLEFEEEEEERRKVVADEEAVVGGGDTAAIVGDLDDGEVEGVGGGDGAGGGNEGETGGVAVNAVDRAGDAVDGLFASRDEAFEKAVNQHHKHS